MAISFLLMMMMTNREYSLTHFKLSLIIIINILFHTSRVEPKEAPFKCPKSFSSWAVSDLDLKRLEGIWLERWTNLPSRNCSYFEFNDCDESSCLVKDHTVLPGQTYGDIFEGIMTKLNQLSTVNTHRQGHLEFNFKQHGTMELSIIDTDYMSCSIGYSCDMKGIGELLIAFTREQFNESSDVMQLACKQMMINAIEQRGLLWNNFLKEGGRLKSENIGNYNQLRTNQIYNVNQKYCQRKVGKRIDDEERKKEDEEEIIIKQHEDFRRDLNHRFGQIEREIEMKKEEIVKSNKKSINCQLNITNYAMPSMNITRIRGVWHLLWSETNHKSNLNSTHAFNNCNSVDGTCEVHIVEFKSSTEFFGKAKQIKRTNGVLKIDDYRVINSFYYVFAFTDYQKCSLVYKCGQEKESENNIYVLVRKSVLSSKEKKAQCKAKAKKVILQNRKKEKNQS